MALISVVIPVYNEENSVKDTVQKVLSIPIRKELIIVNDGSTDRTESVLEAAGFLNHASIKYISRRENKGKGAALREGFKAASGDIFIIQDADAEYSPEEYPVLLDPIENSGADIVFGSRFHREKLFLDSAKWLAGKQSRRIRYLHHYWGIQLVNLLFKILYGIKLSDANTCYKVFRRSVLESVSLTCDGFEFCTEFIAKATIAGFKIQEVPITYSPRSRKEGKKLVFSDGVVAVWTLVRIRFSKDKSIS